MKQALVIVWVSVILLLVCQSCERSVTRVSMAAIQCADRLGNSTTTIQLGRPR